MINLKKVGLTALAGSLVAVSAQAGELSVTGAANVTYTTGKSGDNSANAIGTDKDVKFSGSGELDNGWSFAIHTLSKDDLTVSSTATVITMGSLGSIGFGTGGGCGLDLIRTGLAEGAATGGHGFAGGEATLLGWEMKAVPAGDPAVSSTSLWYTARRCRPRSGIGGTGGSLQIAACLEPDCEALSSGVHVERPE